MRRAVSLLPGARVSAPAICPRIELSGWETKLFRFLRRVAAVTSTTEPVELRVAGGWVRDKLLCRQTGDIDIAVQHTSGYQFASRVHSFAKAKAVEFSSNTESANERPVLGCNEYIPDVSSVAVIPTNPSMSRHLETATLRLDGHDLDFVQLRTEDYVLSESHRIPHTVSEGTPEEDASRRDFTVNALFYNLHSRDIEDFTGHGLKDLADRLLRTPLDPTVTLLEDPLRALRAIRFACRLQFDLHSSLCDALSAKDVRDTLRQKVSRERVGSEMNQIIDSPDAIRGLEMIEKYHLIEPVFIDSFDTTRTALGHRGYLQGLERVKTAMSIVQENEDLFTKDEMYDFRCHGRQVLIYALLLSDTARVRKVLQNALRRKKRLRQDVRLVITSSDHLESVVRQWYEVRNAMDGTMVEEGLWADIAEVVHKAGDHLWLPLLVACSAKLSNGDVLRELVRSGVHGGLCRISHAADGTRLQAELDLPPGPEVGNALRELLRLQFLQYRNTAVDLHSGDRSAPNAEVCLELLKEKLSSLDRVAGR